MKTRRCFLCGKSTGDFFSITRIRRKLKKWCRELDCGLTVEDFKKTSVLCRNHFFADEIIQSGNKIRLSKNAFPVSNLNY